MKWICSRGGAQRRQVSGDWDWGLKSISLAQIVSVLHVVEDESGVRAKNGSEMYCTIRAGLSKSTAWDRNVMEIQTQTHTSFAIDNNFMASNRDESPASSSDDLEFFKSRGLKFRVLILGRANTGKTTILERITDASIGEAQVFRDGRRVDGLVNRTTIASIQDIH